MSILFFKLKKSVMIICAILFLAESICALPELRPAINIVVDANSYDGSLYYDSQGKRTGDEIFLRKAKLTLDAKFHKNINARYSVEYSELNNELQVKDAFFNWQPGSSFSLLLGQFKEPAGLEQSQGLRQYYFLERSVATNTFSYSRSRGARFMIDGSPWNLDMAMMTLEAEDASYSDGEAYIVRSFVAPWRESEGRKYFHLGSTWSSRDATQTLTQYSEFIAARSVGDVFFSANYTADKIDALGADIAFSQGQITLHAEVFSQDIKTRLGDTYTQEGYNVLAACTLMGESRKYQRGRVNLGNAKNTLEVALRYSHVDASNLAEGDAADVLTLGLSYGLSNAYRFWLEYEEADLLRYKNTSEVALGGRSINARFSYSL